MPQAAFVIGPGEDHVMELNLTWWGREEYYLNGELLLQRWSFFGGQPREFRIGEHLVSIALSSRGKEYFGRVFVDGDLYIAELFPELAAMAEASKQPGGYLWPLLAGALAAAAAALWRWQA